MQHSSDLMVGNVILKSILNVVICWMGVVRNISRGSEKREHFGRVLLIVLQTNVGFFVGGT